MASKLHKRIRLIWGSLAITAVAVMFWNMQARDVPPAVLMSDANVSVVDGSKTIQFTPTADTAAVALIFFPGALVQPEAYAPLARAVADSGFSVVLVKLPWRLAPTARSEQEVFRRTLQILRRDSTGRAWIVGGHSRGAAIAALFARDHSAQLAGLLLVGSSHPKEYSLAALDIDVTKIVATEDGLASVAEVERYAANLPPSTEYAEIHGGNHRQFGYYGWQLGDSRATISRDEQFARTRRIVLRQLARVAAKANRSGAPVN